MLKAAQDADFRQALLDAPRETLSDENLESVSAGALPRTLASPLPPLTTGPMETIMPLLREHPDRGGLHSGEMIRRDLERNRQG